MTDTALSFDLSDCRTGFASFVEGNRWRLSVAVDEYAKLPRSVIMQPAAKDKFVDDLLLAFWPLPVSVAEARAANINVTWRHVLRIGPERVRLFRQAAEQAVLEQAAQEATRRARLYLRHALPRDYAGPLL